MLKFSVSPGVTDLIVAGAENNRASSEYTFYLAGDLCQMSSQKSLLISRGFDVQQNNVYPVLKKSDKEDALRAIWDTKTEGWWHYEKEYVKLGICTSEEFKANLVITCEKNKDK